MATSTNGPGVAHAKALVGAGKVNMGEWSFSAEDGNKLLGPDGNDWANYGKWFLAIHTDAEPETKARYGYPFGKNGEVYRNAVVSAKGRAAQQGASGVEEACSGLLDMMDPEMMAPKHQAWSTLTIKSIDAEQRTIEGIASTPTPDRTEDIVEPRGAKFTLPLPLLYQHDAKRPIGHVVAASVTDEGIAIRAQIAKNVDVPWIDEAWALIKAGLVRGLSIGFKPLGKPERIKDSLGMRFSSWDWLELSAVTIPANAEANISTVKGLDILQRAASGAKPQAPIALAKPPGAAGTFSLTPKEPEMKTAREHIQALEAKRAANVARMAEVAAKAIEESRSMDEAEAAEHDNLAVEIKSVDADLVRFRQQETLSIERAAPVKADTPEQGTASRTEPAKMISWGKSNLPAGTGFTRYAMALAAGRGSRADAVEYAKRWHDSTPEVEIALKTAVAVGDTTTSGWASQLVVAQNLASEFIELLRPMTIVGRIPGLRRVPFNVTIPRATVGTSGSWVGQKLPKPVSRMTFDSISLTYHKMATIVVLSEELVRLSNPAAEAICRQDLLDALQQFTDEQFIDPTIAASGTTSPASITYGATSHAMTGTTIANVTTDVSTMFADFSTANIDLSSGVWVMHPRSARYLSMLRTTQDVFAFPTISQNGGTFFGIPVITSNSVPIDTGNDSYIFLINASDILVADDGGINIDVSREASLQIDDAPQDGAQAMVSLWQNNLVGLRAERMITWARRRAAAVSILEDVSY